MPRWRGKPVPSDLSIQWRNDFLKAQRGTFVPFIVTIDAPALTTPSVLLYVRLAAAPLPRRPRAATAGRTARPRR